MPWPNVDETSEECFNPIEAYFPDTEVLMSDGVVLVTAIADNFEIFDSGMTGFVSRLTTESQGDLGIVVGIYWSNENIAKQIDAQIH